MAERLVPAYILDASVAVKWHLRDEEFSQHALAVRTGFVEDQIDLLGPTLLSHEVSAALPRATRNPDRRQRITPELALQEARAFQLWNIKTVPSERLAPAAVELASSLGCSYYDAVYLALSQQTGLPFIYADAKLRRNLRDRFPLGLWIEDYPP